MGLFLYFYILSQALTGDKAQADGLMQYSSVYSQSPWFVVCSIVVAAVSFGVVVAIHSIGNGPLKGK